MDMDADSQMSAESEKLIAKKTRSKHRIQEPIENIIANQRPFQDDDKDSSFLANFPTNEDTTDTDLFKNFLLNTFGSHSRNDGLFDDDHNDDDFNPLDYFDDLVGDGDQKDEKALRVSKKEAKDLQKDLFDNLDTDAPQIDLDPESEEVVQPIALPIASPVAQPVEPEIIYIEEPVQTGMTKDQHNTFINQYHQQIQLLGQSLIMAHHDQDLVNKYYERQSGFLYDTDEILFDIISTVQDEDILIQACSVRDTAFSSISYPPVTETKSDKVLLSKSACHAMLNHFAFPYPELLPQHHYVWINPNHQQIRCWGNGHSISPGEENMFLLFWHKYCRLYGEPKRANEVAHYARLNSALRCRREYDLIKLYKTMRKRKINVLVAFETDHVLPRNYCLIQERNCRDFKPTSSLIHFGELEPAETHYPHAMIDILSDNQNIPPIPETITILETVELQSTSKTTRKRQKPKENVKMSTNSVQKKIW